MHLTKSLGNLLTILSSCFICFALSGCAVQGTTTANERKAAIQKMRSDTLTKIFAANPSMRQKVSSAPGYGVFSNANATLFFMRAGGGIGMIKDNSNGKVTYMRMAEAGLGPGFGLSDHRILMIFQNGAALKQFMDYGWVFGADANAGAKHGKDGGTIGKEVTATGIDVYQLTEKGIVINAAIKGSKFWRDNALNN